MTRPTAMDEHFVHQIPELLPGVVTPHPHWRESYFFDIHDPSGDGDVVFLTMAHYPAREYMDSLQMGRVDGVQLLSQQMRPYDGDPHTTAVPGVRVEVIKPWEELRLWADPDVCAIGMDLTFKSRTQAYGLRRGAMHASDGVVWDQSHILQSGVYNGTYTVGGVARKVDSWLGQRDHSWGIREHGRCPLWLWFQIQLEDGMLGVWHWELANGTRTYTDGCWAGADGSDPVPIVDFHHDVDWKGRYGEHGETAIGVAGRCVFTLADGRSITVDADGTFARPYEPFHRGGQNLVRVKTTDGRSGTGVYEITGARHHKFFPDTVVEGILPS